MNFKLGAILTVVVLVAAIIFGFSGTSVIGVGKVGIVKHMNGQVTELPQGIHWTGWNVSVQEYPTYMQSLVLSSDQNEGSKTNQQWMVGTSDQQELPVNTSLTWKINTKDASNIYQTVGGKDIQYIQDSIVETTMKNVVNRITHDYSWNQIKGAQQGEVSDRINKELTASLNKVGIEVGTFGFTYVGSPAGMASSQQTLATAELNVKQAQANQQKQQIDNETTIQKAQADAQATLIKAQGEAKANQVIAQSVTPALVQYNQVQKWNGVNPTTVLGSGVTTQVQVK